MTSVPLRCGPSLRCCCHSSGFSTDEPIVRHHRGSARLLGWFSRGWEQLRSCWSSNWDQLRAGGRAGTKVCVITAFMRAPRSNTMTLWKGWFWHQSKLLFPRKLYPQSKLIHWAIFCPCVTKQKLETQLNHWTWVRPLVSILSFLIWSCSTLSRNLI